MLKLFKKLKPYTLLIIINVILVSCTAVASLMLPDRMSSIINDGIKEEIVYETTQQGDPIYVDLSLFASFNDSIPAEEFALPKINYSGEGILVTDYKNGKHYAKIDILDPLEKNEDGETVMMISMNAEGSIVHMPVPKFIRTSDGALSGVRQQGSPVLQTNGLAQIITKTVTVKSEIWKNCFIMLAITLASSIFSIAAAYFSSRVGTGFGRDLRKDIFNKVIGFTAQESDNFGTASLITRATNDVTQIQTLVVMSMRMIISVPVMFAGGLIMALKKSADMTIVLAAILPIIAIAIFVVLKKILPLFKSMQKKTDKLTLIARENISGVRVIRAFGGDQRENERYNAANLDLSMTGLKAARYMSGLIPMMMLVMSGTALAIVMIGVGYVNKALESATMNANTITTLGNMMAVIQYVMQIMMSIVMLAIIFIMVPRASVSATRINEILSSEASIKDKEVPSMASSQKGLVSFDDVSFAYKEAESNILNGITFEARPGEITAIIGSTGSGKSTLINLVPRLYDVTSGSIKVDGVDVRDYKQDELLAKIGFVSQKAVLFSGTIEQNIAYGNKDASRQDIVRAAEIAQAKDFIETMENGYDSQVEQGGANFSGGQKQRLSIARAIARKPEIYIFDDSFSALDFKTDAQLRKALNKEIKDSTVFIVAQRIGTVMDANRIIVLADGKIVGIGRHKELLNNCPVYKEIALSQLSHEELGLEA